MKNKKYKLTDEFIAFRGKKLYRIQALKNFGNVKKGDVGGFVESESNLDSDGNAWISDNAKVYENAWVGGNAEIYGDAIISGNARVSGYSMVRGNAKVFGNAKVHGYSYVFENARVGGYARVVCSASVYGNAHVDGNARVGGYAHVDGNAWVSGKARVSGDAHVSGKAKVFGNAEVSVNTYVGGFASVSGNAKLEKTTDILVVGVIGSRKDYTTFFKGENNDVLVNCGCFQGTVEEFEKAVKKTHKGNFHEKQYVAAVKLAKISILEDN